MKAVGLLCFASLLVLIGCSSTAPVEIAPVSYTAGRVIEREESNVYTAVGSTAVPYRGRSLDVARPETVRLRIYTLKASTGETIRTKSGLPLEIGDCVVLRHAPRTAVAPQSEYNFVSGALAHYSGCDP